MLERVELALREGGPPNPTGTPPLEMMVDLRGGVGPPPRDDGSCQGGVDRPPLGMMVVVTSLLFKGQSADRRVQHGASEACA